MSADQQPEPESKHAELHSQLSARVEDKGKEVQDILEKYSATVGTWHEKQCRKKESDTDKVFEGCETIIMILGNILNPDGTPHEWILQRIEKAYNLIEEKNLNLETTCFLPSGGDVSNQKYTYDAQKWQDLYKNAPHDSEATVMKNILINKYKIPENNITRDSQARTTLENFYYVFKILYNSKITNLKNFFLITSDWHTKRARRNFDILYQVETELKDETVIDGDIITRKYKICRWFDCDNIEFIGAESDAGQDKYLKEEKLLAAKWVYPQAKEYSDYVWEWRKFHESQKKPTLKKQGTMGAFAFSTAIEHMYLRLDSAEHGLVKVVH